MSPRRQVNGIEELSLLRQCYASFRERRSARGHESIRTRSGFDLMCEKFPAREQFLTEKVDKVEKEQPFISQEINVEKNTMTTQEQMEEITSLRSIVGVYFDREIQKILTQTWWPMVNLGEFAIRDNTSSGADRSVSEWKELDFKRYLAVNTKILMWLFPGLPTEEAQVLAERDWVNDVEFDVYSSKGLSFQAFCTSLIDLATTCTDGTIEKCIDFLELSSKWLCTTLGPLDLSLDTNKIEADGDPDDVFNSGQNLPWKAIRLEEFTRLEVKAQAQYIELKATGHVGMIHPLSILLLATEEQPIEAHFCTDMKCLLKDQEEKRNQRKRLMEMSKSRPLKSCSSRYFLYHEQVGPSGDHDDDNDDEKKRKKEEEEEEEDDDEAQDIEAALMHPIWSFDTSQTQHSNLLMVEPHYFIDKKNPVVYGYIRLKEQSSVEIDTSSSGRTKTLEAVDEQKKEEQLDQSQGSTLPTKNPTLSLYTSLQEPTPLSYGIDHISYGKLEQHTCCHFTLDHQRHPSNESLRFKIIPIYKKSPPSNPKKQCLPPTKHHELEEAMSTKDKATYDMYIFVVKLSLTSEKNKRETPAGSSPTSRSSSRRRMTRRKKTFFSSQWQRQWQFRLNGKETTFDIHMSSVSKEEQDEDVQDTTDCLYLAYLFSFQSFYYELVYYSNSEHEQLVRRQETIEAALISSGKQKRLPVPEVIKGKPVIPEKRVISNNNSLNRSDSVLRSKLLTAKAMERRHRFLQAQERELNALHERILKKEKKIQWLRTQRGVPMMYRRPPPIEEQEITQEVLDSQQVYASDELMNTRMELMVALFKQMAKVQPTKEEQRKNTNKINLDITTTTTNDVHDQVVFKDLFAEEESEKQLEFVAEEYQSTAEYIQNLIAQVHEKPQQLTLKKEEVDREQTHKAELDSMSPTRIVAPSSIEGVQTDDSEKMSEETKQKLFEWVCSLEYAKRRIDFGACNEKELEKLEQHHRTGWMYSSYNNQISQQTFEDQQQDLPWQAQWQIENEQTSVAPVAHPHPPKTARATSANTCSSLRRSRPKTAIQSTATNAAVISYETTRMLRGKSRARPRPMTVGTSPIKIAMQDPLSKTIPRVLNSELNRVPDITCLVSILSSQAAEIEQDERNSEIQSELFVEDAQEPLGDLNPCETDVVVEGNEDALPELENNREIHRASGGQSSIGNNKPSQRGRKQKTKLDFELPWSYMGTHKPVPPSSVVEAKEKLLELSKFQPEAIMATPSSVSNGITTRVVVHGDVYDVLLHHNHVEGIQRHQDVIFSRPWTTNIPKTSQTTKSGPTHKRRAQKKKKTIKKTTIDPRLKELEEMLVATVNMDDSAQLS